MHKYNEAWLELSDISRESLTPVDMKNIEEKVTALIQKWRDEEDYIITTMPAQMMAMGMQPTPDTYVKGIKLTFKTLADNPMIVDKATIQTGVILG